MQKKTLFPSTLFLGYYLLKKLKLHFFFL